MQHFRSWITRELADCHMWYPEEVFIISFCVFPFVMAAVLQLHHVMTLNWVSSLSHKVRNSSPKITAHFNLLLCVIKQILSSHSLTLQSWAVYGCKVSRVWPIYYLDMLGQTCYLSLIELKHFILPPCVFFYLFMLISYSYS